jgi:uncharacterized protein YcfJ
MKYPQKLMLLAAMLTLPVAVPTAAIAQSHDNRWQGDQDSNWDPSRHYDSDRPRRELSDKDRVYRGSDGRYYCKRSDGTTGLVLGAVGGGVLGNVIGGGLLGTVLGGAGGALLGKHLDKKHDSEQNAKNGYVCD